MAISTSNYLPAESELDALGIKFYSPYPDKSLFPKPVFHYNEWYFQIRKSCLHFSYDESSSVFFNRINEIRVGGLDYYGHWHLHNVRVRSIQELNILLWQMGFLELPYFQPTSLSMSELNNWRTYTINDKIMQSVGLRKSTDNVYRRSVDDSTDLAVSVDYDNLVEFISYYEYTGYYDAGALATKLMALTRAYWTEEEADRSFTEFMELRNGHIKLKIYSDDALRLALWQLKFTDILPTDS